MKLTSLPDCKLLHPVLTVGNDYAIVRQIGNGVVIVADDGQPVIVLLSRLA